jgi:hypothetical protein
MEKAAHQNDGHDGKGNSVDVLAPAAIDLADEFALDPPVQDLW